MGHIARTKPSDSLELAKGREEDMLNDILKDLVRINESTEYEQEELVTIVAIKVQYVFEYIDKMRV